LHAVVVTVNVQPGHDDEGAEYVQNQVIPSLRQIPGILGGYWLAPVNGQGLTIFLFDNEHAAQGLADGLPNVPMADFATLGSVEVREIIARL
jgi:hypothetical protein